MLKRPFLLIAAALSCWLPACGVGGTVDDRVDAARARNDAPPIWRVSDHDSDLFLFGTVHLLPDDLAWQKQDMQDAFAEAGTIFFEVDSGRDAMIEASLLSQQLGQQSSGLRLSSKLDSYQLKLLEAVANNGNIDIAVLDSMKPWLASEFLTVVAAAEEGLSPEIAADEALKNRARRQNKNVVYLDTVEGQIRASADQPEFVQLSVLTETMEQFGTMGLDLRRIAESWAMGDTDVLRAKTVIPLKTRSPELYNSLITDRNAQWTKTFARWMDDSGTGFAAVGVSHLLGDESLQNMLREQGYTVKRYYAFQGDNLIRTERLDMVN